METSKSFGCKIIEGVNQYSLEKGNWMLLLKDGSLNDLTHKMVGQVPCDGIIARSTTKDMFAALRKTRVPTVELLGDGKTHRADITTDRTKAGEMAFEHLHDRKLRHFAFFSLGHCWWSREVLDGYSRQCRKNAFPCHVCEMEKIVTTLPLPVQADTGVEKTVACWLESLPKPIGILCPEDGHAAFLVNICIQNGLAVPFDTAVLGIGNNPTFCCNAAWPPLSSIVLNCTGIGYRAAKLLDDKMHETDDVAQTQRIPPLYIAVRHSTNFAAVVDEDVGRAIQFVSENMGAHCTLEQIAAYVGLSKRTLIRRFHSIFGHPPEREIFLIRLNRAKELLIETELSIKQIAHCIGYQSTDYFVRMFRQHVGTTPLLFRQQGKGLRLSISEE